MPHGYITITKLIIYSTYIMMLLKNYVQSIMLDYCLVNLLSLSCHMRRISLDQMYNYKNTPLSTFKANCVKTWNNLPFDYKTLPCSSNKEGLFKLIKARKS